MDEIIMETQQEETPGVSLATVAAVTANGVRIQIDGEDTAGVKEYQCNTAQAFSVGDRVKITDISGSFLIEYKVGAPGESYPLPAGGSAGQYLRKSSNDNYAVEWAAVPHELPTGGAKGAVLCKNSADNYDVAWIAKGLPAEGTTGQILAKNSATSYDVGWKTIETVPSSGTVGYVLTKTASGCAWDAAPTELPATGTTGYVLTKTATGVAWQAVPTPTVTVDKLTSGTYTVTLNSTVLYPSANNTISLGDASHYFNDFRQSGNAYIGYSSTAKSIYLGYNASSKIGFFGHAPHVKTTVATTASLATLITALNNYGLV